MKREHVDGTVAKENKAREHVDERVAEERNTTEWLEESQTLLKRAKLYANVRDAD